MLEVCEKNVNNISVCIVYFLVKYYNFRCCCCLPYLRLQSCKRVSVDVVFSEVHQRSAKVERIDISIPRFEFIHITNKFMQRSNADGIQFKMKWNFKWDNITHTHILMVIRFLLFVFLLRLIIEIFRWVEPIYRSNSIEIFNNIKKKK